MIGCLIFDEKKVPKPLFNYVIEDLLHNYDCEQVKENQDTSIIFVKHNSKVPIWQAVFELEFAGIAVGYGFGETSSDAKNNGIEFLVKRLYQEKNDNQLVQSYLHGTSFQQERKCKSL